MSSLIVRNQYGVHPDDERFVESKVREILQGYEALNLLSMQALEQVWIIGQLLIELKGKVFHGQWMNFCQDRFKSISQRSINYYMQLAAYRSRLEGYFKIEGHSKIERPFYSDQLPGIEAAIKIIQSWSKRRRVDRSERKVSPKEYCPTCGQVITKPAKTWMKEHSGKP